jgi:hypothetical protein
VTKLIFGAVGLALLCGLGCVHLQPVGPLMKPSGEAAELPKAKVSEAKDVARMPTVTPLPPPPPPAVYVTPGEVTEANHAEKARRLLDEMEADRKAMEAMPRASEVSVIKR